MCYPASVMPKKRASLADRVARAAEAFLEAQHYVSPIDVLVGIGWVDPGTVKRWRQGQIDCLEEALQTNPSRITEAGSSARTCTSTGRATDDSVTVKLPPTASHRMSVPS